jgi:hypothetical protein
MAIREVIKQIVESKDPKFLFQKLSFLRADSL